MTHEKNQDTKIPDLKNRGFLCANNHMLNFYRRLFYFFCTISEMALASEFSSFESKPTSQTITPANF